MIVRSPNGVMLAYFCYASSYRVLCLSWLCYNNVGTGSGRGVMGSCEHLLFAFCCSLDTPGRFAVHEGIRWRQMVYTQDFLLLFNGELASPLSSLQCLHRDS